MTGWLKCEFGFGFGMLNCFVRLLYRCRREDGCARFDTERRQTARSPDSGLDRGSMIDIVGYLCDEPKKKRVCIRPFKISTILLVKSFFLRSPRTLSLGSSRIWFRSPLSLFYYYCAVSVCYSGYRYFFPLLVLTALVSLLKK